MKPGRLKPGHLYGIRWALANGIAWYVEDVQRVPVPMGGDAFYEVRSERLMVCDEELVTHRIVDRCVLLNGEPFSPRAVEILDEWDRAQLTEARRSWERAE